MVSWLAPTVRIISFCVEKTIIGDVEVIKLTFVGFLEGEGETGDLDGAEVIGFIVGTCSIELESSSRSEANKS